MKSLNTIFFLIALLLGGRIHAQSETLTVKMLPGENWWGGLDNPHAWPLTENGGHYTFPMDENTDAAMDFNTESYSNNCVQVGRRMRMLYSALLAEFVCNL